MITEKMEKYAKEIVSEIESLGIIEGRKSFEEICEYEEYDQEKRNCFSNLIRQLINHLTTEYF